jgi:glyoxylase-like metal-dependent hydrolase (beta-lactamase superfamily II)
MRVHSLNCGCMCPVGGALYDGFSRGLTACLVCHCLLIETDSDGLVLVDTGFGSRDIVAPKERLSSFFRIFNNIKLEQRYTALTQVQALGYKPSDVRHIVLTHLDFDHAGGLDDFPDACVHVMENEWQFANSAKGPRNSRRFRKKQWDQVKKWSFYDTEGDNWKGFAATRSLVGVKGEEVRLVPLAGHTAGHAGILVQGDIDWMLHAGDAYFYRGEVGQPKRSCPPGLRLYQRLMDHDHAVRMRNQVRLRQLSLEPGADINLICSHDALILQQAQQLSPRWLHKNIEH